MGVGLEIVENDAYMKLRSGAEIIEADRFGEKVLRLADGSMVKLFRRKRLLSSAAWYPYAQRFADNCKTLAGCGVRSPEVIAVFRLPSVGRDAVHYRRLEGETIRQLIERGLTDVENRALRVAIRDFIAVLHEKDIYFRSLHLGNIVRMPSGELGLIDVADMTFKSKALGQVARRRNMKHMLRYSEDASWLGLVG